MIFSYNHLPLFKLRLSKKVIPFLIISLQLFSCLQVSSEVTVLVEVSPRLLCNVHGYRSGHMQGLKI